MRGLQRGPDWATLNPERLNRVFQTLYIVTAGCDYVSYFKNIGEKTFIDVFFKHASFINGMDMPCRLPVTNSNR